MECIVKDDNRRTLCCPTSDLNRVFNCFGSTIEEESFFREFTWSQFDESLGEFDIWLVHHNAEAGMREFLSLFCDRFRDFWTRVANVHSAYAACKVNVFVAIYIFDYR